MARGIYTTAIFLGAFLLFFVQPMFARMVLPLLGGTPAVWNTCAVFFQSALLLGYLYAHLSTELLGSRRQSMMHLVLLAVASATLPIGLPAGWTPPSETNPIGSLLGLLARTVGPAFFIVAATGPLVQKWFADSGQNSAGYEPYFLYSASNLGSMLALIAFPVFIEPALSLPTQSRLWTYGYWALIGAMAACAAILRRSPRADWAPQTNPGDGDGAPIGWKRRLRWMALAFIPSSLTIGATTYITSDIASIPLFWVMPLAIYLLSFILVFSRRQLWPAAATRRLWPPVIVALAIFDSWYQDRSLLSIGLHLANLFLASMACHGALAADRPPHRRLTEYYLLLSLGGNLGGIFNAIVAPLAFSTVLEYPLMLAAACLFLPQKAPGRPTAAARIGDLLVPALLFGAAAGFAKWSGKLPEFGEVTTGEIFQRFLLFAAPALACLLLVRRPFRFALGIAAALAIRPIKDNVDNRLLFVERSFFGVHKVLVEPSGRFRRLLHGTTVHGIQQTDPAKACMNTAYYHPTGPLGEIMRECGNARRASRVAILGLGVGGLSAYREAGQQFDFFEIDPTVKRIAEDPRFFTYLTDCCGRAGGPGGYRIILGDGRLKLAEAADGTFGLIVMDAFGSDAVPMHLLTREALAMYRKKLTPGGVIAFNLSTRIVELPPVVARIARDEGMRAFVRIDLALEPSELDGPETIESKIRAIEDGKAGSIVVAVAMARENLGSLAGSADWIDITERFDGRGWTDDFSNLLETIHWR